ncbi:MAG: VOC family protein [Planctomycetes bacterium]|nr:VOC family protein [Planctomycetota bacterium]
MRIGHIELFVKDADAAKDFYTRVLGAELVSQQADGHIVWVKLGDVELLLRPGEPGDSPDIYKFARAAITLYTDDLDAELAKLKLRGLAFEGDDGPGCPTFRDPDGNWFQLTNPGAHR